MGNSVSNSQDDQVLPEKPGDSSTDSLDVFMKGGGCKETWTAFQDCMVENKESGGFECDPMLYKCMEAHSEYYHPVLAADKAATELGVKVLVALCIPSAAGKEEALLSKEMDEDEEEEALEKYISFMGGDDCKEPARAWVDCMVEAEKNKEDMDTKCCQHTSTMMMCMRSHSDQYQPLIALTTTTREHMRRDLEEALGIEIPKKGTFQYLEVSY